MFHWTIVLEVLLKATCQPGFDPSPMLVKSVYANTKGPLGVFQAPNPRSENWPAPPPEFERIALR